MSDAQQCAGCQQAAKNVHAAAAVGVSLNGSQSNFKFPFICRRKEQFNAKKKNPKAPKISSERQQKEEESDFHLALYAKERITHKKTLHKHKNEIMKTSMRDCDWIPGWEPPPSTGWDWLQPHQGGEASLKCWMNPYQKKKRH